MLSMINIYLNSSAMHIALGEIFSGIFSVRSCSVSSSFQCSSDSKKTGVDFGRTLERS